VTDEEMSELAECLADACANVPRPFVVTDAETRLDRLGCCPMGALVGLTGWVGHRYPLPDYVMNATGLPDTVAGAFIRGFDGGSPIPSDDPRVTDLGRLFHEEYCR